MFVGLESCLASTSNRVGPFIAIKAVGPAAVKRGVAGLAASLRQQILGAPPPPPPH